MGDFAGHMGREEFDAALEVVTNCGLPIRRTPMLVAVDRPVDGETSGPGLSNRYFSLENFTCCPH
jgi:hypothetical protein